MKNVSLQLSENAIKVLESRYLLKNDSGELTENPMQMFERVANYIILAEDKYNVSAEHQDQLRQAFLDVLTNLEFLPNSPTFSGAGTKLGQLAACFVLPVGDSMEEIFDAIKNTALIHKSGGGTGFSFSRIRPKKSLVRSTTGLASGPISFMTVFDAATDTIKQGGTRRGANMGILRVDHPDIMEFITAKENSEKLNNFNISVAITDVFMSALEQGVAYDLIDPHTGQKAGSLDAKTVWGKIIDHAWQNGDPGIVFIDKINKDNPTPHIGEIESTNPCGEQPLLPYEACNLGSINLAKLVKNDAVDYERLGWVVKIAVRFLDDVIDMNRYPIPQIAEMARANRKIGLGVMGWADMLIQLNIAYNSQAAIDLAEKVMGFIQEIANETSVVLSKEKGSFPNFEGSIYDTQDSEGMRNATRTTIAPTGTLSIIASCSSGIEPLFALAYIRKSRIAKDSDEWVELLEVNPVFEKVARERGFYSEELMEKVSLKGSIQDLQEIPADVRSVFVTSHDISPQWHVKMQSAFQNYVDNAVSKTINFPHSATREDVADAYMMAYRSSCKGITIYRDGSRSIQVLNAGKESKKSESAEAPKQPFYKKDRPEVLSGATYKLKIATGTLYFTVNNDEEGKPFEVFATIGKAGGFFAAKSEAICRLISLSLRAGIPVQEVIKQLKGIRGPMPSWNKGGMILSLADAIAQLLEKHITQSQPKLNLQYDARKSVTQHKKEQNKIEATVTEFVRDIADFGTAPECPECYSMLEVSEGCLKCQSCGFSKCA